MAAYLRTCVPARGATPVGRGVVLPCVRAVGVPGEHLHEERFAF